jgi:hypothetical protein|tara:strand:+ start:12295 stop:12483 length:189 start_codon:yes stop_codon:yes gene_type:complete
MNTHDQIREQFEQYIAENAKFAEKQIKVAGTRARKALNEIGKLTKVRRKEIQEEKNTTEGTD